MSCIPCVNKHHTITVIHVYVLIYWTSSGNEHMLYSFCLHIYLVIKLYIYLLRTFSHFKVFPSINRVRVSSSFRAFNLYGIFKFVKTFNKSLTSWKFSEIFICQCKQIVYIIMWISVTWFWFDSHFLVTQYGWTNLTQSQDKHVEWRRVERHNYIINSYILWE